jgi:Short C-terminal domain
MQPSNKTIIGVAMLLFGAVVLGVGMHHLVATGTCSSTGYSSHYGPVPYCPKGTGWWILFVIGGIFLAVIGGLVSGTASALLIVPAVFTGIGIGALTVAFDSSASSSTKTFGAIFGGAFAFFGLVPLLIWGISALRRTGARTPPSTLSPTALKDDPIMGAYMSATTTSPTAPAGLGSFGTPTTLTAPSTSRSNSSDALDKIEKLAKLHDQGALTEDEFNREKAKLLAEL